MQMMMPMMMMMYMQQNNGTFPGMGNITKTDNATDPFFMLHHYIFPVPEDEELSYFKKFLYYCPWGELTICAVIMGLIFGLVIYFFPKEDEPEPDENEEAAADEDIASNSVRTILDSDADDAAKLAKIRELVGEKRVVAVKSTSSSEEKTSAAEEKTNAEKKDD